MICFDLQKGLTTNAVCVYTDLWSRGYFKTSSYSIVEAGPAGHVGRNINIPAVQIYGIVPRRGSAFEEEKNQNRKILGLSNDRNNILYGIQCNLFIIATV